MIRSERSEPPVRHRGDSNRPLPCPRSEIAFDLAGMRNVKPAADRRPVTACRRATVQPVSCHCGAEHRYTGSPGQQRSFPDDAALASSAISGCPQTSNRKAKEILKNGAISAEIEKFCANRGGAHARFLRSIAVPIRSCPAARRLSRLLRGAGRNGLQTSGGGNCRGAAKEPKGRSARVRVLIMYGEHPWAGSTFRLHADSRRLAHVPVLCARLRSVWPKAWRFNPEPSLQLRIVRRDSRWQMRRRWVSARRQPGITHIWTTRRARLL